MGTHSARRFVCVSQPQGAAQIGPNGHKSGAFATGASIGLAERLICSRRAGSTDQVGDGVGLAAGLEFGSKISLALFMARPTVHGRPSTKEERRQLELVGSS